jgi:hypothetical protein
METIWGGSAETDKLLVKINKEIKANNVSFFRDLTHPPAIGSYIRKTLINDKNTSN